jgi:hypothetical protein
MVRVPLQAVLFYSCLIICAATGFGFFGATWKVNECKIDLGGLAGIDMSPYLGGQVSRQ